MKTSVHRLIFLCVASFLALGSGIGAHAQSSFDEMSGDRSGPDFRRQQFPDWMNEKPADDSSTNRSGNGTAMSVADPVEPLDPDAQPAEPSGKRAGPARRFTFTPPQMPDFSKFRQKATRTGSESNAETGGSKAGQASVTSLLSLPGNLTSALASLTTPPAGASAATGPKGEIPKRFYRPTGYRSFMQEALEDKNAEDAESASSPGQ